MHTLTRARRTMLYGLTVVIAACGFSGPAHAATAKKATCTLKTIDAAPTAANAEDYGTLKCSGPFGAGVQHNTGTLSPTAPTAGTIKGSSTLYFATGTVRAAFSLKYELSGSTLAYGGTAKVLGGTGAYKGISGSVKLQGSSADGGAHGTMTEQITLKLR